MSIIRNGFESADLDVPVVLPTLNLDFANSQSLDERITFSRGSVGTFVNKNGLIETAPANQPRFDYDPISGECRGLLIEESRANLISSSNGFGGDTTDYGITSGITSPDGTTNAVLMYEKTNNGYHFLTLTPTLVVSTTYCASIFCKYAGSKYRFRLKFGDGLGAQNNIIIDLRNGSIISGSGVSNSYGVIKYPNGWYRVYTTLTATSTSGFFQPFLTRDSDGSSIYQGDGSSGYYIYGAQVEAGAFPTSYIPTSGSTVTRSADNADMTGSNFTSWANSSVGTFVIRGRGGQSTSQTLRGRFVGLGIGGAISLEGAGTAVGIWDTTNTFTVTNSSSDAVNRNSNIAASFDGTLRRIVFNGTQFSGISRRNINTIFTQISLGKGGSNANYLNGTLSRVAYYPRQLNDAQMLYLTT